jgi:hypothetical protein
MHLIYVLFVITHVYGGATLTTQEFTTASACESAKTTLLRRWPANRREPVVYCHPKGD